MINSWADTLAASRPGNAENNRAIVAYGLNVFIFNFFIALLALCTALAMDILSTAVVVLVSSGSLRVFTGGFHFANPFTCMLSSVIIVNALGFAAYHLAGILSFGQTIAFLTVVMFSCIYYIIRKAPVETPNKPIKAERRPILKKIGIRMWFCWVIIIILILAVKPDGNYLAIAAGLGIANQTLSISGILKNKEV